MSKTQGTSCQQKQCPAQEEQVEEKAEVKEEPKAEVAKQETKDEETKKEAKESKAEGSKKHDKPETKKAAKPASPPMAPLPPGAQAPKAKAKAVAKQPAKDTKEAKALPKKKVQQPGPPQQPGLITPETQAPKKGGKGEKGKGAGKKGSFPGVQLCVRNLVKDATPEQLRSLFLPFGELIGVDVKKNTDGTCRGYGFVTFTNMGDANKAITGMNNKQVEGKNLIVVLSDRQKGTTKAEREAETQGKGKGKEPKGEKGKGTQGKGGKAATPAPTPQAGWPYAQNESAYPYAGYGYPMVSPMAAYANQGYPNSQAAAIAMQAQLLSQAQQAFQTQQAFYSSLTGLNAGLNPSLSPSIGASIAPSPPAVKLPSAPAPPSAPASGDRPVLNQEYEGNLKSISAKNGYGFISCDETKAHYKRDVFVDSALLPEGIQVNDKVIFSLALSEKGHPRATSVKMVGQVPAR
ncbi:unnamed protein product [Effrenium voratum]|uniref:RRM domain-containing protein n=1 Tax=Effrenium voratum TaxID=2562239 RepID=A0AA36JH74_9DINO|nr:unnamed protein product [Effrenium voratum]